MDLMDLMDQMEDQVDQENQMDPIGDQTGQMMDLTTPGIQEGMTIT